MNKFSIENQAQITISVVKLEMIMLFKSNVPSSECFNRLLTRNSLVHTCLLLYIFLQQIGKNSVAANAKGCLYVQHLITTKNVAIYLHFTMTMIANYGDAVF